MYGDLPRQGGSILVASIVVSDPARVCSYLSVVNDSEIQIFGGGPPPIWLLVLLPFDRIERRELYAGDTC